MLELLMNYGRRNKDKMDHYHSQREEEKMKTVYLSEELILLVRTFWQRKMKYRELWRLFNVYDCSE